MLHVQCEVYNISHAGLGATDTYDDAGEIVVAAAAVVAAGCM